MHASLSRFLSMKGAGNVATSTARPEGNPIRRHSPHSIPDASSISRMRVSCYSARSGQTKQECNTKAQNLNLRCCGWLDFHEKTHRQEESFSSFPFIMFLHIIAVVHPGDAEKSLLLLDFLHLYSPPTPHCNLAVYPIEICVSWHSYRVEHN